MLSVVVTEKGRVSPGASLGPVSCNLMGQLFSSLPSFDTMFVSIAGGVSGVSAIFTRDALMVMDVLS